MPGFDLPATGSGATPQFTDAAGCSKWLQTLPLINVGTSHGQLLAQLEALNGHAMPHAERFKVLELLREPVMFVQKEQSKKFANRPAPLSRPERETYADANAMWDALSLGYQRCLQAADEGAKDLASLLAQMCQRVLWCTGQKMVDCYQAYQDVDGHDWKLLHGVYEIAEKRGVASDAVAHPAYKNRETTCIETYTQVLLLNLASPGKLTPRQIELISRWLERWARKVSISPAPTAVEEGGAPLIVDLAGDAGAARAAPAAAGQGVRYLEVGEVGKSVRKRVSLLRKGETPAALGLGEDITAALAEGLLVMLYRRWCEDKQSRAHPRRSASGTARICSGMPAMHYFVTGKAFRGQGGSGGVRELSKRQHEEIATFGRVATRHQEESAPEPNFPLETWQIKDESVSGLQLERIDPAATSRLLLTQLLGIRPADAKGFFLCTVRWLSVSADFELRAGVYVLPGVPLGIAIRAAGGGAAGEEYTPALALPAVAALKSPDTLVLPPGWFKPKRAIEVLGEGARKVTLTALVDRGADFERVTFESA